MNMNVSYSLSSNKKTAEAHFGLKKKSYFVPNIKHSPKMAHKAKNPICVCLLKPATKQEEKLEKKVLKYLAVCRECSVCRLFYRRPEEANACLESHRLRRCFICFTIVDNDKWNQHFNECHKDPTNPPNCVNCSFCFQLFSYLGNDLEAHVIKTHPESVLKDAVMSGTVATACKQTPHDTISDKTKGNNVSCDERQLCVIGNGKVKGNNIHMRWDKPSKSTRKKFTHPKISVGGVRESNEKKKGSEPLDKDYPVSLSSEERMRDEESETASINQESSLESIEIESQMDTDIINSKDEVVPKELCPQKFSSPLVRSFPKVYELIDIASEDEQDEPKEQSPSAPEPPLDIQIKENILSNSSFDKIAAKDQNKEQQQQANNNGTFYDTDPIVSIPVDSRPSVIKSQTMDPVNKQLVYKPQSSEHLQFTPFQMPQTHQMQSNPLSNVSPPLDERQFRYYNAIAYLESQKHCNQPNFMQQQNKANCWNATVPPPSYQQTNLPVSSNNYPQINFPQSFGFPRHSHNPNINLPMQFTNYSNLHTNIDNRVCSTKSLPKFGQNACKIPSKSSKYRATKKCPKCDKTFVHLRSLQRHLDTHFGIWPCICKICPKVFLRSKEFIEHALLHHKIVVPPISKSSFNRKVHVLDLQ